MHRFLIAAAIVVGLCALGAVGFVIHKNMSGHQPAVVATTDEGTPSEPVKKPARPARTTVARNMPAAAPDAAEETAESAVKPMTAVTGSLDVTAFLDKLTPDEEKALGAAMFARAMKQRMQDRRYQLPVTNKFNRLDRDPKLALTDAQKNQLNTVMQGVKPQMDAAFKDAWAQQDQLRNQIFQTFSSTTDRDQARQQTEALRQQMDALTTQMQPQQETFNQQVMAGMTPYLTPEQIQAVNSMPADTGRGFGGLFGGGGPGGGGPPFNGNNGGGGRRGGGGAQPSDGKGGPG